MSDTAAPFHYDIVGSFLRPEKLRPHAANSLKAPFPTTSSKPSKTKLSRNWWLSKKPPAFTR